MTDRNKEIKRRAIMSLIGALLLNMAGGLAGAFSFMILPVTNDLGFTQASFAGYISFMAFAGIFAQPMLGKFLVKYKAYVRPIILGTGVLGLLLLALAGAANKIWHFYVLGVLQSLTMPFLALLISITIVSYWFAKYKSIAMAIVTMGTSLGTVFFSNIASRFISAYSWRVGFVSLGVSLFVVVLIAFFLISPPPEAIGLTQFGADEQLEEAPIFGYTRKQVVAMPAFWIYCISTLAAGIFILGIQQSLAPMIQIDYGKTAAFAASMLSLFSLICCGGKLIAGIVFHKAGPAITFIYTGVFMMASLVVLLTAKGTVMIIVSMMLLGLGNVVTTAVMTAFLQEMFGNREYSAILGFANRFFLAGTIIGPFLVGRLFDATQTYKGIYWAFVVVVALNLALNLISYGMLRKKEKAVNITAD